MLRLFEMIERLSDSDVSVLITGETGTGKELVARALHETGPRRGGSFFSLHCASLPSELVEAELCGYESGAFTGAEESRPGLLESLSGGTLLLDELGDLGLETQARLLGIVSAGAVRPLGGVKLRPVDVRLLAAAKEDLERRAAAGAFRADLLYRLAAVTLHVPPLRSRREDIPLLAGHFLALHSRRLEREPPVLDAGALALLKEHDWPGNVRQLEATLLRLLVTVSPGVVVRPDGLLTVPPALPGGKSTLFDEEIVAGRDLRQLRRELDRVYLTRLFRDSGGDLRLMARTLGVKLSNLYHWLRKVGIDIRTLRREMS